MADVFLSYARADFPAAKAIAARLKDHGFSVWFDENLPAHRAFADVIQEELEAARSVLVLWSESAVSSQWVRSEANRGREMGKLAQVRLDNARLPLPFDQIQCVDLGKWNGDESLAAWQSVIASFRALSGNERSSPPEVSNIAVGTRNSRRGVVLAGAATAAVGALAFAGWRLNDRPDISPEATLLIQKGLDALQNNDALETQDPGSTLQAIALLTDATEAAPQSPTAWGGLAMAYAVRKRTAPMADRPGLELRSRAAARKALQLEPTELRALGALRLLDPVYRNWSAVERADREALTLNPTVPILLFILSDMLGSVGRWREASVYSKRLDRKKFLIPGADRKLVIDLWASGDLQGADKALETAVRQWPQHPQIWRTRMIYLIYSGRASEALAFLRDGNDVPPELKPEYIQAVRITAEALSGQRPPRQAVSYDLDYLRSNPVSALQVAQACVALGDPASAFELLKGYYFGEGEWRDLAPKGGDQDRLTNALFLPSMRSVWRKPDFHELLERIGLNAYWARSGTLPDFRKG
jgi:tetratricopeptide (TPR) repeat protein